MPQTPLVATIGLNGPDYDLGPVHDWLAFRDDKNKGV